MIGRWLREPLLHFVLLGAVLFGLYRLADPGGGAGDGDRRVVVTAGRVAQLTTVFTRTWQRPPTPEELRGLIDDWVLEEIYYRRALAMGIDKDDTMIRRRLRQKLEFLMEDTAALIQPGDEELQRYLEESGEKFRRGPFYTFRQIYFDPVSHGDDPRSFVGAQLAMLNAGRQVAGDRTLIPERFVDSSGREVDGTFGTGFSRLLDELPPGVWSEPIRSGLGLHLVRVDSRREARVPPLSEIRDVVARAWANDRRLEARRALDERLLQDYEVVIDWPEAGDE